MVLIATNEGKNQIISDMDVIFTDIKYAEVVWEML